MGTSSWNALVIGLLLLAGLAVAAFNVLLDPYGVFGTQWRRDSYSMNERYLKIDYLLEHGEQYNAFLVGSSVMGAFSPKIADQMSPGRRYYNLSFLGGTPAETLQALRTLRKHGIRVEEVVMGIDIFSFRQSDVQDRPDRRMHPAASGESLAAWKMRYLFEPSFVDGLHRIRQNVGQKEFIHFDIRGGGRYLLVEQDEAMRQDPEKYRRERLRSPKHQSVRVEWVENRFRELQALIRWLDSENTRAVIFIHPVNRAVLATYSGRSLDEFRTRIKAIVGDVPDFTRVPQYGDDRYYYDLNHYTPELANIVMREVMSRRALVGKRGGPLLRRSSSGQRSDDPSSLG